MVPVSIGNQGIPYTNPSRGWIALGHIMGREYPLRDTIGSPSAIGSK